MSLKVIKVQVLEVDQGTLLRASKGEEFADNFSNLIASITNLGLTLNEHSTPGIICVQKFWSGLADSVLPGVNEKILLKVNECINIKLRGINVGIILKFFLAALRSKFAEIIPAKLAENGVAVDLKVCTTEDEAEVFFEIISHLQGKQAIN